MLRPDYTVSLFRGLVQADGGFVVADDYLRDTFLGFEPLWDTESVFTAFTGGKEGKLYMVNTEAQAYRAFRLRVEQDSGFVVARKHTTDILKDDLLRQASIGSTMSAGKAGKLYAFTPLEITAQADTMNVNVTLSNGSSAYRIAETPRVEGFYLDATKTNINITVDNIRSAYTARFYESIGTKNNFTNQVVDQNIGEQTKIFQHTEEESNKAYKYKVSYFVRGNIDGNIVEFEGTRSSPVYLLGNV